MGVFLLLVELHWEWSARSLRNRLVSQHAMQCADRGQFTVDVLSDCHEVMAAR